ncbi:UNVERIFIED_CONTAM: Synaptonemal complex protein ZEP1 [Sesamum angustifolium]|uniref:Synaptonemal complex protein ZEP1 n=1 Tax=Sesamum angustifolium TaxID=2727405 RepID=A0AAW2L841_9LAMI
MTEQIHVLEEKLQNAFNENAKLKVKQKEDEKLWEGLESKFSSTKTLCDQLTETLHRCYDKTIEEDVAANKVAMESLTSKMEKLHFEMRVKEDDMQQMSISKEKLENENKDLLSSKNDFANRLEMALKEIKKLEDFVNILVLKFTELESQSLTFSEKVMQLSSLFDSCLSLAQQERDLVSKNAKQKFDQIHNQCTCVISEKNALQLVNHELNNKVLELQKEQEFAMVQHAEECRLAEEKIRKLESEAETLVSKQTEMQALIVKLEDELRISSENSTLSDKKMVKDHPLKFVSCGIRCDIG